MMPMLPTAADRSLLVLLQFERDGELPKVVACIQLHPERVQAIMELRGWTMTRRYEVTVPFAGGSHVRYGVM